MNKYQWKLEALAKRIDPEIAVQEFDRVENLYGSLTPENVVKASESPDAVLHALFEWDNEKAGHKYRLQQARQIINNVEIIKVSGGGKVQTISNYEIVKVSDGRAYKSFEVMTPDDKEYVRLNAVKELTRLKEKIKLYNELKAGVPHIERAIESIS